MRHRRWIAPLFLTLLLTSAQAQRRGSIGGDSSGSLHVHIVFDNDRAAGSNLLVSLMSGSTSTPVATTYTNSNGQADFNSVRVGDYHLAVSGDGIESTESGTFEVDSRKVTQAQFVTVHRTDGAALNPEGPKSSTVSAAEMNVPPKAQRELDKANEAMTEQNWKKAMERLNKAIAIYPGYAAAYNNLGVFYSRMNDDVRRARRPWKKRSALMTTSPLRT